MEISKNKPTSGDYDDEVDGEIKKKHNRMPADSLEQEEFSTGKVNNRSIRKVEK